MIKEGKMLFQTRRLFGAALIVSVFFQMHIATSGYASPRAKIAFTSVRDENSDIYVMNGDGGDQVRLTINPARDYDPSWSPDGDRIAFVSNRERGIEQIYVMDSDGSNEMRLTNDATHQEPAWSPVGEKIAYVRNKGGRQIWLMDADGGNQTQLTEVGKSRQPANCLRKRERCIRYGCERRQSGKTYAGYEFYSRSDMVARRELDCFRSP